MARSMKEGIKSLMTSSLGRRSREKYTCATAIIKILAWTTRIAIVTLVSVIERNNGERNVFFHTNDDHNINVIAVKQRPTNG